LTRAPFTSSVSSSADRSLAKTTGSKPPSTATSVEIAELMAVTGTCPFSPPAAVRSASSGSSRRRTPISGTPAARATSRCASVGLIASAVAGWTTTSASAESLPPPTGSSAPRPPPSAGTGSADRSSTSHSTRCGTGSRLTAANSPSPCVYAASATAACALVSGRRTTTRPGARSL
jgi:hypothetical protein